MNPPFGPPQPPYGYPPAYAQPAAYYPPPYGYPTAPPAWQCPFCHAHAPPVEREKISTAGWVLFGVLLLLCLPLFWIGLLLKERWRVCGCCGQRVGGVA